MNTLSRNVLFRKSEIPSDLLPFFEPAECGECYICKLIAGFREVWRVLRDDGTLWCNLGDSYASAPAGNFGKDMPKPGDGGAYRENKPKMDWKRAGLKPKDLCGIPWRVALALRADGWYLRSEIIWAKRNCMPESVTDRPTKSHEQIFLLAKKPTYFYDAEAVKVPASDSYANDGRWETGGTETNYKTGYAKAMAQNPKMPHRVFNGERRGTVNLRDVWHISSQAYPESHFATFPEDLVKPCILAGTSARGCCPKCGAPWERVVEASGGTIGTDQASWKAARTEGGSWSTPAKLRELQKSYRTETKGGESGCKCGCPDTVPAVVCDPFAGSFTTCQVALELGRSAIGIELNPAYVKLGERRCVVTPGLSL